MGGSLPPESTVLGEYETRAEMQEEIDKRRWKGDTLLVDFLIDGKWYRGNLNSRDPIAWSQE